MFRSRARLLALGLVGLGLGGLPTAARAQLFGGASMPPYGGAPGASQGATSGGGNMAAMANPYTNPYMNPFINPYMTQMSGTMPTGNAAMYFLAAQQMNGGLGSGRLGGPNATLNSNRPGAGAASAAATRRPGAAVMDPNGPGGANTPGALASRYFNRTAPVQTKGLGRYYARPSGQFPRAGR